MLSEMICIVCPMGCRMTLNKNDGELEVEGNNCPKGREYAYNETVNPVRMVQSTVVIQDAPLCRIPVRTSSPVPKGMIMDCMEVIRRTKILAPVKIGDIIISDINGTGADIVASRSMPAIAAQSGDQYQENTSCRCSN